MLDLTDILGASFPDTVLVVDRGAVIVDACIGADRELFDASPKGRRLADLWPAAQHEVVLREVRKILKSRRPQTAWVTLPGSDGKDGDWELRLQTHGRERVMILARSASSLSTSEPLRDAVEATSPDRDVETGLRTRRWLCAQARDMFNNARLREENVAVIVVEFPQLDTVNVAFG
ncbi:MAG: PAS domain-containing protein, partial [Pseudomonadota bacterium]